MILAPRRHLYATNIIIFVFIYVLQKFITLFCIIEEKTCNNENCTATKKCDESCTAVASSLSKPSSSSKPPSLKLSRRPFQRNNNFSLIPISMRKAMRNFGFGEGHYQLFVEEKQRYQPTSEARLNAAEAELKLNPN